MAKLTLIVTEDGEGYYLSDGTDESEAADWVEPVEFQGTRYLGEVDDEGENVTLSKLTPVNCEVEAELDGENEDEEEAVETE